MSEYELLKQGALKSQWLNRGRYFSLITVQMGLQEAVTHMVVHGPRPLPSSGSALLSGLRIQLYTLCTY